MLRARRARALVRPEHGEADRIGPGARFDPGDRPQSEDRHRPERGIRAAHAPRARPVVQPARRPRRRECRAEQRQIVAVLEIQLERQDRAFEQMAGEEPEQRKRQERQAPAPDERRDERGAPAGKRGGRRHRMPRRRRNRVVVEIQAERPRPRQRDLRQVIPQDPGLRIETLAEAEIADAIAAEEAGR